MRVEIPYEDIHKIINARLRAAGIDPDKEMKKWCRIDGEKLILVYQQGVDEEIKQSGVFERPSYLKENK